MNGCSRCVGRALPSGKTQHTAIKRGPRTARPVGHEITPTNDLHDLTGSDGQSLEGSSWGGERVALDIREERLSSVLVGGRAPRERCRLLRSSLVRIAHSLCLWHFPTLFLRSKYDASTAN